MSMHIYFFGGYRSTLEDVEAWRRSVIAQIPDMLDQIPLLAALRHEDGNLVAGLFAECGSEQFQLLDRFRQHDLLRHRLVVVELRHEGVQHFGARKLRIGLWEIGAIAPVLSGAEEEHLDAGNAALMRASFGDPG